MDYAPLNVLWNTSQSSVVNEPCRWKAGTRSEIPRVADPVLVDDITENNKTSALQLHYFLYILESKIIHVSQMFTNSSKKNFVNFFSSCIS